LPSGDKDYGIDLIGFKNGLYSAIQCKFKAPRPPIKVKNNKNQIKTIYPSVNWKELATFNELCNATGPWNQRLTMTTAPYVRRLGGIKDQKDKSICIKSFQSISIDDWIKLIHGRTSICSCPQGTPESREQNQTPESHEQKRIPESHEQKRTQEPYLKIPIKLKSQSTQSIPTVTELSQEELRNKRLLYYQKLSQL
jgi:hypothetical protein